MDSCVARAPGSGLGRGESFSHCAALVHLQYVLACHPESHHRALQEGGTALFVAMGVVSRGVRVSRSSDSKTLSKRWRGERSAQPPRVPGGIGA
jgi:hypothetical protein